MDKQLVFPFITEDNLMNGKTCEKCLYQKMCADNGEVVSIDKTCGDWKSEGGE